MKYLFTLAIGFGVFTGSTIAADTVTLRWFGHSFFQIESPEGVKVVFDPHAIEEYGQHRVSADYALISHPHEDHNQVLILANRQEVKVLEALAGTAKRQTWKKVDTKVKDVQIQTLPATVGTYHDRYEGEKRGKNGVFIVDVAGLRFVHLGDLGHVLNEQQVKALGKIDVLMIPIGGVYTINGSDAAKVVESLEPRYVVPMHFGTEVYDYLLGPEEFLINFDNIEDKRTTNEFVVDPAKLPAKGPVVVRLGWKKE